LPEFENWETRRALENCPSGGRDFYDVFDLPNNCLGPLIADVADKGVPAALFMALTRTLVRAAVIESGFPPLTP